jgi:hypothetical protein
MSGGFAVNAGGIFASGTVFPATPAESDRPIHLMIYQLASYMNAKELGANIQNAAQKALGGAPKAGEIQATPVESSDPNYFATDIRPANSDDRTYAVGISPNVTYFPDKDPDLYYVMEMQDLSIVLTVLQLSDAVQNRTTRQPVVNAALAALKALSSQLEDRAERQGWKTT